jgi:hypothetical protein
MYKIFLTSISSSFDTIFEEFKFALHHSLQVCHGIDKNNLLGDTALFNDGKTKAEVSDKYDLFKKIDFETVVAEATNVVAEATNVVAEATNKYYLISNRIRMLESMKMIPDMFLAQQK